ncbi:MAG TPA: hypothetical protein VGX28_02185 [Frankiaceae bacterium]|jgi:hypothetical protein|nr:hypothetical protein [Frankiaceae bacterium]
MSTKSTAATALAAVALAGSACTSAGTPTTVITVAPAPFPAILTPTPTPTASAIAAPAPPKPRATRPTLDDLKRSFADTGDPKGTPVQFAIRYIEALRAGRWQAAVAEMAAVERASIRVKDNAVAVGRDVLRNATGALRTLPRCTSGAIVDRDAVLLRCGAARVVIHVDAWTGFRGVKVADVFVASDHYGHPHTHAYTSVL